MVVAQADFLAQVRWVIQPFQAFDLEQLYEALRLRSDVFVVEQNCMYADLDGKDQHSWHVLGYAGDQLVAYARLIPPGISYEMSSIGRVVTHANFRHHRLGTALMEQCIAWIAQQWPGEAIKISAQYHLKKFYNRFGFEQVSDPYDDAGIPHIAMLRAASHGVEI